MNEKMCKLSFMLIAFYVNISDCDSVQVCGCCTSVVVEEICPFHVVMVLKGKY